MSKMGDEFIRTAARRAQSNEQLRAEVDRLRTAIQAAATLLTEGDPEDKLIGLAFRLASAGLDDEAGFLRAVNTSVQKAARILAEANALRREELRQIPSPDTTTP
jgi:hypothetical protein